MLYFCLYIEIENIKSRFYNSRSLRFFSRRSSRFDSFRSLLFNCCLFVVFAKFGYNELDLKSNSLCDVARLLRLLVRVLSVLVLGVRLNQREIYKISIFIKIQEKNYAVWLRYFSYIQSRRRQDNKTEIENLLKVELGT